MNYGTADQAMAYAAQSFVSPSQQCEFIARWHAQTLDAGDAFFSTINQLPAHVPADAFNFVAYVNGIMVAMADTYPAIREWCDVNAPDALIAWETPDRPEPPAKKAAKVAID